MRILQLGRGTWTVQAICTDDGECPVMNLLMQSGKPGLRLLADLQQTVPARGPGHNEQFSKYLRDDILEFRQPTSRGGTPRVLYFYDAGRVVVCTGGELKKSNKTSDALIDQAIELRERYRAARAAGDLIVDECKIDEED
jgi:phage-related protein